MTEARAPALPAPRLGVCWYPEQWPEAWWADDARQMAELGIHQVRIAEFAWSRIEPEPGHFDWAWLDRAIDTLHAAGLVVVLGTPTATPPKWLIDRDPGMLALDLQGRPRGFGSRRHYCFSSDTYLTEACRITRAMAERYGRHPAVLAWQTDNEYGCHDTVLSTSAHARRRFRLWLRERYGTIEALNAAWGTVFWSQEYRHFGEVDLPVLTVTEAHPAHRLDWRRFASDEVRRFNAAQVAILRTCSPGRRITHNLMLFFTEFDHHALAEDLDCVSWDSYPLGALENFWFSTEEKARWLRSGHPDFAAFHHDLYRGMSREPFWVMEQQPGPVNWGAWNPAPAPGMVRLWSWEAIAHGADVVSWFRWRQAPFAQEQMHAGLQMPDRGWSPGGHEARQVARELTTLSTDAGSSLATPGRRADVALVFDYASRWAMEIQPQGADENGLRITFECYAALRGLGLDVDIVGPSAELAGYALIVLPAVMIANEALAARLAEAAAHPGTQVLLYPRSGSKTAALSIPPMLPPGPLAQLIDLRVAQVESLRPGITFGLDWQGQHWHCARWREFVDAGPGVEVLARFDDGPPALLRRGGVHYMAARPEPALESALLATLAQRAGLAPVPLPDGLRLRRRGELLFVFNYAAEPQAIELPGAEWLLGGPQVVAHGLAAARRTRRARRARQRGSRPRTSL